MTRLPVHFNRQSYDLIKADAELADMLSLFHWYLVTPRKAGAPDPERRVREYTYQLEHQPAVLLPLCRVRALSVDNKREVRLEKLALMLLQGHTQLVLDYINDEQKGLTVAGRAFFDQHKLMPRPKFADDDPLNVQQENLLL